ncbi:MAG: AI-2E family transporter [Coriobacteriia bacterium]|nr:AI-2E family transporter [Coriobacteriia bacterium]
MTTPPKDHRLSHIPGVAPWLLSLGINVALVLVVGAGIAALLYVLRLAATITVPLIVAAVIAIIAHPLVNLGARIKLPRALSAIIVIVLVVGLVAVALQITVNGVVNQAPAIGRQIIQGTTDLGDYAIDRLAAAGVPKAQVNRAVDQATQAVSTYVHNLVPGGGSGDSSSGAGTSSGVDIGSITSGLSTGFNQVKSVLSGVLGAVFMVFLGILCLFFFLTDYDNIMGFIGRHLGVSDKVGADLVHDGARSLRAYFRSTTVTALVVSLVIGAALAIMKVPLVLPIMIVSFLVAYVPIFGALISSVFACLVALGSGGLQQALIVLIVVLVAHNIIESIVNNFMMSKTLDLHPLATLVATILGSTFGGVLGMTLAAPVLSMALSAYKRLQVARGGEEEGKGPDEIRSLIASMRPERKQVKIIRRRPGGGGGASSAGNH